MSFLVQISGICIFLHSNTISNKFGAGAYFCKNQALYDFSLHMVAKAFIVMSLFQDWYQNMVANMNHLLTVSS